MVIIVMGVMGSGKTTVGRKLADALGCPFFDADDYHPASNREKMSKGIPLTEEDRKPWLENLSVLSQDWSKRYSKTVLACSALKQEYRRLISNGLEVHWVYLKGDRELILKRLEKRSGHFASPQILHDQFGVLEEPENAIVVDIRLEPDEIIRGLAAQMKE